MTTEIELKLVASPAALASLRRSAHLRQVSKTRPVTRTLHSVYYDTPDQALRRMNAALRLRRLRSRWIQTFKCGGGVESGLHERQEFEAEAVAQLLNVPALLVTPAADLFADAHFRSRLAPVFTTDFRRSTRIVEIAPGETAELALDEGTISAGDATLPLHEIELELIEGSPRHLFAFARTLLETIGFRLENASKAERGYALANATTAHPVKATAPRLERSMTGTQAFRAIVANCTTHLQANDQGVLDSDDPEYVHQARVAIRRLRSAFSVFRPVVPKAIVNDVAQRFRALGVALGHSRDWDVFLTETLPPVRAAFAEEPGLDAVATAAHERQAKARDVARDAFAAREYPALLLDLAMLMVEAPWEGSVDTNGKVPTAESPLDALASWLLARQCGRVRRRGKAADRDEPASLHALRIEIKKLRYIVEFFAGIHPARSVRRFASGSAELQDILGALNDAAVTARLLQPASLGTAGSSYGAGIIRGWTHARAQNGLVHFDDAWRRFKRLKPYW